MTEPIRLPASQREAGDALARAYAESWERIEAAQQSLVDDPLNARKRARLGELQAMVAREMSGLDTAARQYISREFPKVSQGAARMGFMAIRATADSAAFTQSNQEAAKLLAEGLKRDLLEATSHVDDTTKKLIRKIGRDAGLKTAIDGKTARQAATEMRRILNESGIHAVKYANGAKVGLKAYTEMAIRTTTAIALNEGALSGSADAGCLNWEVFDGLSCGWTGHGDSDRAHGKIVTREQAQANLIAHPNCRRAFGPRPDLGVEDKPIPVAKPEKPPTSPPAQAPTPKVTPPRAQEAAARPARVADRVATAQARASETGPAQRVAAAQAKAAPKPAAKKQTAAERKAQQRAADEQAKFEKRANDRAENVRLREAREKADPNYKPPVFDEYRKMDLDDPIDGPDARGVYTLRDRRELYPDGRIRLKNGQFQDPTPKTTEMAKNAATRRAEVIRETAELAEEARRAKSFGKVIEHTTGRQNEANLRAHHHEHLHIEAEHEDVHRYLEEMDEYIPGVFHDAFRRIEGDIYMGEGGVPDLDSMGALANVQARGWPPGTTMSEVTGGYDPLTRNLMLGKENHAHNDGHMVALHEGGHGMDDAVGIALGRTGAISNAPEWDAVRQAAFGDHWDLVNPYYSQPGQGGISESWAESFGYWARHRGEGNSDTRAAKSWDAMMGPKGRNMPQELKVERGRLIMDYFDSLEFALNQASQAW